MQQSESEHNGFFIDYNGEEIMLWWKRTILSIQTILDRFETYISIGVNYFVYKILGWIYDMIIVPIIAIIVFVVQLLLMPFLFIILLPFSIGVSIYNFTKSMPVEHETPNNEPVDLINKK